MPPSYALVLVAATEAIVGGGARYNTVRSCPFIRVTMNVVDECYQASGDSIGAP